MIPEKTNRCWRDLVTQKKTIQTEFLGLQMILKRMQRRIKDNSTDADLQTACAELREFIERHQSALSREIQSL